MVLLPPDKKRRDGVKNMGYIPTTPIAFAMVFITMLCWASWANTMKKCGNWRFEGFYWDYAWSIVLWTLLLAVTLGGISHLGWQPNNFFDSLKNINLSAFLWASFAGFVWGIGNILLVAAIALTGFSIAFPLGLGLALVLGTFLAFITNPAATHRPLFLFVGLIFVTLAIIANGIAYRIKEKKIKGNKYFKKGLIVTILCGILISLFPFPFNYAFKSGLNGYGATLFMTLGAFVSTLVVLPIIMKRPLIPGQRPIGISEYLRAKPSWHGWAVLAGLIWAVGTTFNLVVASQPTFSVAIAYTLGQCATMVAALWGIFVWKEFKGAPSKSYLYLGVMFALFILGIISLANATG